MIEFDESKRNFLRSAVNSTAVLAVATVAPLALAPLLKPEAKFHVDLDVNSMYPWPAPDIGSLYFDTDDDKLYHKIKLNEQYGAWAKQTEFDAGYFYAPCCPKIKSITVIG